MLTEHFLLELFKLSFLKKQILEVLREHVKYQYLPDEIPALKKILKAIISVYGNTNNLPTFGAISQFYPSDIDVQDYLQRIKNANIPDTEQTLKHLEEYIKLSRFQLMFEKSRDLYNNDKQKEAIEFTSKESEEIVNFSITQNTSYFVKVFAGFNEFEKEKNEARDRGDFDKEKVPFGITCLDEDTYGGIDKTDTVCFLARSGEGKSTILKHIGMYACRMGYKVLHIQLESSRTECLEKYHQLWLAKPYMEVKYGDFNFTEAERNKVNSVIAQMIAKYRDIDIYGAEQFDEVNCNDIRNLVIRYGKENGEYPDLILVDYLGLLHPGDGIKYGIDSVSTKARKENSAKKLKNIALEFKTRVVTAEQADGIEKQNWNSPDWNMDRHNVSGAKNLSDSFSYFITWNRTEAEAKNGMGRLYKDKLRNYHPTNKVSRIATAYEYGRFYDLKRTKELGLEELNIKPESKIKGTRKSIKEKIEESKNKETPKEEVKTENDTQ